MSFRKSSLPCSLRPFSARVQTRFLLTLAGAALLCASLTAPITARADTRDKTALPAKSIPAKTAKKGSVTAKRLLPPMATVSGLKKQIALMKREAQKKKGRDAEEKTGKPEAGRDAHPPRRRIGRKTEPIIWKPTFSICSSGPIPTTR